MFHPKLLIMKYSVMFHHFHDDSKYPNFKGGGSISAIDFHSIIDYIDENFNLITPDEYTQKVVNESIKEFDVRFRDRIIPVMTKE